MCVNVWNSVNDTHNQGVDGSSPSGPTEAFQVHQPGGLFACLPGMGDNYRVKVPNAP